MFMNKPNKGNESFRINERSLHGSVNTLNASD